MIVLREGITTPEKNSSTLILLLSAPLTVINKQKLLALLLRVLPRWYFLRKYSTLQDRMNHILCLRPNRLRARQKRKDVVFSLSLLAVQAEQFFGVSVSIVKWSIAFPSREHGVGGLKGRGKWPNVSVSPTPWWLSLCHLTGVEKSCARHVGWGGFPPCVT